MASVPGVGRLFPIRHGHITIDTVGYNIIYLMPYIVINTLSTKIAVSLRMHPIIGKAVAARAT